MQLTFIMRRYFFPATSIILAPTWREGSITRISYFCPPSDIRGVAIPNVISIKFSYTEGGILLHPVYLILFVRRLVLSTIPLLVGLTLHCSPSHLWPSLSPHELQFDLVNFQEILNCLDNAPVQIEDNACTKFLHILWRIYILIN